MRLGISAGRLVSHRYGVGHYIEYLLREWARVSLPFDCITLYTNSPIDAEILGLSPVYRNRVVKSPIMPLFWEQVMLPVAARHEDVLFCPSYTMPLAYPGRCVVTNHAIYDFLPGSIPWSHRLRYSLLARLSARRAPLVLAVSESGKRDLMAHWGIPAEKIQVVYPAADERFRPIADRAAVWGIKQKYGVGDAPLILFVGKLSRRRHVSEVVRAFQLLKRRHQLPHKLLIVGPDHLHMGIEQHIAASGVPADIVHVPYVDHKDMPLLYNAADLYIMPTEHEGFSVAILEAMRSGCPVVTLDHPSLHEGLYDGVHCAANASPEALCEAMLEPLTDPTWRHELGGRARAIAETFTWERAAQRTLALLLATAHGQRDEVMELTVQMDPKQRRV
jgi:glycosyltransferase involved in cell wall biosynthesis